MATSTRARRWRNRLIGAGAVLLLAGGALAGVRWYVASGRLAEAISASAARILPGRLAIGSITFAGLTALDLHEVVLGEDGHRPLARIRRLEVRLDPATLGLASIRAVGLDGYFDAATYDLLDRIDTAVGRIPPTDPPISWDLLIDEGDVVVADGPHITGVSLRGRVVGPLFQTMSTGTWDGRPVRVGVRGDAAGPDSRRITVELHQAAGRLGQAVDGLAAMGLLPAVPAGIKAWLPGDIDATGSTVRCDLVNPRLGGGGPPVFRADATVRWAGGQASAQVVADQRRIQIDGLRLEDPAAGSLSGAAVTWDIAARRLSVACPGSGGWRPGPRLPIPAEVPVAALLKVMPAARLTLDQAEGREALELVMEGRDPARDRARLAFAWQPQGQLRVEGRELPLALLRTLVPRWLDPAGQAPELRLAIDPGADLGDGLREVWVRFRQGRLGLPGGLSVGPVDGEFALRPSGPLASAPFAATCTLARGGEGADAAQVLATASFSGTAAEGVLAAEVPAVEALAGRIRGLRLPRLRGGLAGEARLGLAGPLTVELRSLALTGLSVGPADGGAELVRGLSADLRGVLRHEQGAVTGKIGGQLRRGVLAPGGMSVDLAADHPLFTLDGAVEPGGTVLIRELLVRAADEHGAPAPARFSGQFAGRLDQAGNGRVEGVVDHADLGWVVGLASRPEVKATGEVAIACTAELAGWDRLSVEGALLPLGIDLRVGSRFRATGVSGAVRFTLTRTAEAP